MSIIQAIRKLCGRQKSRKGDSGYSGWFGLGIVGEHQRKLTSKFTCDKKIESPLFFEINRQQVQWSVIL